MRLVGHGVAIGFIVLEIATEQKLLSNYNASEFFLVS